MHIENTPHFVIILKSVLQSKEYWKDYIALAAGFYIITRVLNYFFGVEQITSEWYIAYFCFTVIFFPIMAALGKKNALKNGKKFKY